MAKYRLKKGTVGIKVVDTYKNIEDKFTNKFLETDKTSPSGYTLKTGKTAQVVTGAYRKVEDNVVGAYKKIETSFVDTFLEKVD